MSTMNRPTKTPTKMTAPPKPKKSKKKRKAKTTPSTPNPTGAPAPLPDFTPQNQDDFERMQKNCYEHLHKPRVTKITNWGDKLYYICKECMDKYIEEHEELKPIIVSFGR